MKYILGALLMLALYVPTFVSAETVLRIGEGVSVDADQIVDGDYYVSVGPFGNTTMSGSVTGDMYAFGGFVTANGAVGGDVTIVGGTSHLHATVTDDVRIVSGEVTLADHVGGDLFVIGGVLNVLSSATVDGDIIFFGGDAEINGTVGGSILGTSERIRIDAKVGGDVDIKTATALTLGERTSIAGSLRYASSDPLVRSQSAVVEGEVIASEFAKAETQKTVKDLLVPVFVTLFAALSFYSLFRKEMQLLVEHIYAHPLQSGITGLSVFILGPVVSVLLIMTVLGIFVGIAGLAATLLIYILGLALSGAVLGAFLSKVFTKKLRVSLVWIVIGTGFIHGLLLLPFAGVVLVTAIFALTIGGIAQSVYRLLS